MRFGEFVSKITRAKSEQKIKNLDGELASKDIPEEQRKKILLEKISFIEEELGMKLPNEWKPRFSTEQGESTRDEKIPLEDEETYYDLIEKKKQLKDAIDTYKQALEDLKRDNPADFALFKKINGALRGSQGVLKLLEEEIKLRDEEYKAA